jgi:hypothetical protein
LDNTQGLKPVDVSLGHTVPPFGLGDGAATREHGEWHVDVIPRKGPYFLPPDRRVGHQKAEVWMVSRPGSDKDVHTTASTFEPCRSWVQKKYFYKSKWGSIPGKPHTGSQRPQYAGSLKESSDATPSHRTAIGSGEIDVMAHQILTHSTPHTP